MYPSSLSPSQIQAQHRTNLDAMASMRQRVSPVVAAAGDLAQIAREIKVVATELERGGQHRVVSNNREAFATKDLIRDLKVAKDALKSLKSKAESLDQEVRYFSNHQIGLMNGNMRLIPPGDKVHWCTGQVNKIQQRAARLVQSQRPAAEQAVDTISRSSTVLSQGRVSTNLPRLLAQLGNYVDPNITD